MVRLGVAKAICQRLAVQVYCIASRPIKKRNEECTLDHILKIWIEDHRINVPKGRRISITHAQRQVHLLAICLTDVSLLGLPHSLQVLIEQSVHETFL